MRKKDEAVFDPKNPLDELKRATAALKESDLSTAVEIAEAFIADLPEDSYGYILLGVVAELSNERSQAIDMFARAHDLDPECRELTEVLSNLNFLSGNITDGIYFAKITQTLLSDKTFTDVIPYEYREYEKAFENMDVSRHYIEAIRAYDARQYNDCVDECVRELRQNNHHKLASELLGYALLKTNRAGRAVSAFQTAIHLNPKRARSTIGLAEAILKLGRTADAESCFYRALDMDPDDPVILAQCQRGLSQISAVKSVDLKQLSDAWRVSSLDDLPSQDGKFDFERSGKIRVGVVSDMFYNSHILPYIMSLFQHCDRTQIEIRLYSLCQVKDSETARLRNVTDTWREIEDIDQYTLAETLGREELDIIVDLCFEADAQAIELFMVGAAKKQVSWFTAFEATSFIGMTHILSDSNTESVDQVYKLDKQVIVQPENGILTREPFVMFDEMFPSPVAENKSVIFGMRADPAQITPVDALMIVDLLRSVPRSRLMLGLVKCLDKETQERLLDVFSLAGGIGHILFQELPGSQEKEKIWHDICTGFFQDVDVFLSPSKNIEFDDAALSLWMGTPIVAMQGTSRIERLTASVLTQAERSDWVAKSPQEFLEIGMLLAGDVARLADMRETLRDDVLKTNLFNNAKVTQEIWKSLMSICEE